MIPARRKAGIGAVVSNAVRAMLSTKHLQRDSPPKNVIGIVLLGVLGNCAISPNSALYAFLKSEGSLRIARYKQKTEAEVAWDRIRREVEYRLNLEAAQQKAEAKNEILPTLQERFEVSLAQGKILSLAEALDEAGLLRAISA